MISCRLGMDDRGQEKLMTHRSSRWTYVTCISIIPRWALNRNNESHQEVQKTFTPVAVCG